MLQQDATQNELQLTVVRFFIKLVLKCLLSEKKERAGVCDTELLGGHSDLDSADFAVVSGGGCFTH